MKSTKDIDALIREALGPSEGEIWDDLGEQSLAELLTETFFGRRRFLNIFSWIFGLAFFALSIYCVVRMFEVQDVRATLLWLGGAAGCIATLLAMKIWSWLELTRISLMREVKRVELQLAHVARRLEAG